MHLKIFAALFPLTLAACAMGAAAPQPRQLLLAYEGPAPQVPSITGPRLVVRAVNVPDYLDRRELVRRVNASEVVFDENAHWAERPSKAITRWVTLKLGALRSDYAVESYTPADGRAPAALLAITLEDFAPGTDGVLRLRGSWVFARTGQPASQYGRFDADARAKNSTAEASVAALQAALVTAVEALSAQLPAAAVAPATPP